MTTFSFKMVVEIEEAATDGQRDRNVPVYSKRSWEMTRLKNHEMRLRMMVYRMLQRNLHNSSWSTRERRPPEDLHAWNVGYVVDMWTCMHVSTEGDRVRING